MSRSELLTYRDEFMTRVEIMTYPNGRGWDVMLSIDGTYQDRESALAMAQWWREQLNCAE